MHFPPQKVQLCPTMFTLLFVCSVKKFFFNFLCHYPTKYMDLAPTYNV